MRITPLFAAAAAAMLLAGCAHDGRGRHDRTIVYGEGHDRRGGDRWDRRDDRRHDRRDDHARRDDHGRGGDHDRRDDRYRNDR